ncbi:MAG TPA: glycosyltransferase family 4 protein [Thermoanaerobaculia bacterium]|nr:glycosyltransferase family 4 protein [Thermoanaerobaculia bacterium]
MLADDSSRARRMRFLFVLEHFPPYVGGVETLFGHLVTKLAYEGHQVTVVTSRLAGTAARETWNGATIVRVATPPFLVRYAFTLLAIPHAIRHARGVDVVHTTLYNAAFAGWIGARLARACSILSVLEVFAEQWSTLPGMGRVSGLLHRLFEWAALRLPFDHFVCISEFTRGRLVRNTRIPENRTSVVYPAVDYAFWDRNRHAPAPLREMLGLPKDCFLYLYFGRPGVSKGVEYLIEAASFVSAKLANSRLILILGTDPQAQVQSIRRHIERLGLTERIVISPPVPRETLPEWLLAADCVVVPSISEGFGYSAVEAASLGCKVIATNGHAIAEVIPDGAIFVPPRSPRALADAIVAANDTPTPPRPEPRYTLENHLDRMLKVYEHSCAS